MDLHWWSIEVFDGTLFDGTLSDGTLSGGTLSGGTLSGGTLSGGTLSGGEAVGGAVFDRAVFGGVSLSAARWQDAHGNALTEAAITHGAYEWHWHQHSWGVLFEIAFRSDEQWSVFRDLPGVRAALDAVPDPVNGLLVYPGRGGSSGRVRPRRPRPVAGAGAAELPVEPEIIDAHLATCYPAATTADFAAA